MRRARDHHIFIRCYEKNLPHVTPRISTGMTLFLSGQWMHFARISDLVRAWQYYITTALRPASNHSDRDPKLSFVQTRPNDQRSKHTSAAEHHVPFHHKIK